MPLPFEPDFTSKDIATDQPFDLPNISDDLQQTLAHLIGYFEAGDVFKLLRADNLGRLHVTFGAVGTGFASHRQVSVALQTVTKILSENLNRRELVVQNVGSVGIRVNFTNAVSASNGFLIEAGTTFTNDVYFGELFAFAQSGSTTLEILEF